jgi:hypothetical protein
MDNADGVPWAGMVAVAGVGLMDNAGGVPWAGMVAVAGAGLMDNAGTGAGTAPPVAANWVRTVRMNCVERAIPASCTNSPILP